MKTPFLLCCLPSNPDISRVRGVHLQGIQGRSRSRLLQALDNEANGRLGLARRVKIFEKLNKKTLGANRHLTTRSKIVNNTIILLLIKRPLENFHEIFGLKDFSLCLQSFFIHEFSHNIKPDFFTSWELNP